MAPQPEFLVLGCREADLEQLRDAAGPSGPRFRTVASDVALAQAVIRRSPVAVVVGLGTVSISRLEILQVIHSVRENLPVIIVGEEDSLDLERRARAENIFCYLVHPIDPVEAEAVVQDVLRRSGI